MTAHVDPEFAFRLNVSIDSYDVSYELLDTLLFDSCFTPHDRCLVLHTPVCSRCWLPRNADPMRHGQDGSESIDEVKTTPHDPAQHRIRVSSCTRSGDTKKKSRIALKYYGWWLAARAFYDARRCREPTVETRSLQHLSVLREESWKLASIFSRSFMKKFDTHQESPIDDNPFFFDLQTFFHQWSQRSCRVSQKFTSCFFHDQLLGAAWLALVGASSQNTSDSPRRTSRLLAVSMAHFSPVSSSCSTHAGPPDNMPVSSNSWWLTSVKAINNERICRMQHDVALGVCQAPHHHQQGCWLTDFCTSRQRFPPPRFRRRSSAPCWRSRAHVMVSLFLDKDAIHNLSNFAVVFILLICSSSSRRF